MFLHKASVHLSRNIEAFSETNFMSGLNQLSKNASKLRNPAKFLALGIPFREAFRTGIPPINTRPLALARNLIEISPWTDMSPKPVFLTLRRVIPFVATEAGAKCFCFRSASSYRAWVQQLRGTAVVPR